MDREAFSSVCRERGSHGWVGETHTVRRCDWVSAGLVENHTRAERCGTVRGRGLETLTHTHHAESSAALTCWMGDRGYTEWGSWRTDEIMERGAQVTENVKWHQVGTHDQNGQVRGPGVLCGEWEVLRHILNVSPDGHYSPLPETPLAIRSPPKHRCFIRHHTHAHGHWNRMHSTFTESD